MRRYILGGIFFITASLIAITAQSQDLEPKTLSLQQALDYAVKNNTSVKNAQLDVLIQQAQNAQVTAAAYPKINGAGNLTDYVDPVQSFIPGDFFGQPGSFVPVQFTPKYAASAAISGSQIIFDGSVLVALQARKTIVELARQKGKLTEIDVKYNVQKAYHALVIAQKQYGIIKQSLAYARDMANDLNVMRENGFVEKIEIDRTNVQVNNLASDSMRISNLLEVSEQLLKYQMGMSIDQPIVLTDTVLENHIMEAASLTSAEASYDQRTEFNLLNTQLKLNEYNLKRYRYSAYPSLSAIGNMGYNYASNDFKEIFKSKYIWSSYIGLQLNVPIFNGLQRTNQVKETKLNIEKSKNDIENIKRTIDFQTQSAKTTLRNSLLQLESQKRNLELSNSVLDLARRKYKEGVGSNLEVTEAQTQLLQSQNNYFNSMLDIINAEADLQKALGQFK